MIVDLLACIFSFKNTHNSNVSKAKRREEGHDFYTEGFPATIQFIRDQLAEVCREADFKTCACLFTSYRRYLLPTADDQAF